MVIEITRREVLNNLIRFKDNLLERHGKEKFPSEKNERVYKVLLNRRTGDMKFAKKISSLEEHLPKNAKSSLQDWKEVHLIVDQKSNSEPLHFEVRDALDQELKQTDIDPLAWRIARETLNVLNIKGKEVKDIPPEMLPEEAVLQDLSSIRLTVQGENIEALPGWAGAIDRFEAERRLIDKGAGAYLIRQGDLLSFSIAFQLEVSNHLSAHPYVITFLEEDGRVSEFLIFSTDKGWILYSDEPKLNLCRVYPSIQILLQVFSSSLRFPLSGSF